MQISGWNFFVVVKKFKKDGKIPLFSPPSLLLKSSPLTVLAPTVNNRGRVKRINGGTDFKTAAYILKQNHFQNDLFQV